jgi:uncharacterized protein
VRTLLRSDWLDAADPVRYAVYAVIYAVWALAVVHSFRKHRAEQRAAGDAPNVVVESATAETAVPAGRPSAPRD